MVLGIVNVGVEEKVEEEELHLNGGLGFNRAVRLYVRFIHFNNIKTKTLLLVSL
jgi:hypothetical protein